jgi:hypothetical protein
MLIAAARRLGLGLLRVGALLVMLVFGYVGWAWFEGRQLHAYCDEVKPGMLIHELPALTEKHGFGRQWVICGQAQGCGSTAFYVPATTSLGELVCAIRHDGQRVLIAQIGGR